MSEPSPSQPAPVPVRDRIQALHAWYCDNVMSVPLAPEIERLWLGFFKAGYNGHQLAAVIQYLRRQIAQSKRNIGSLKLTNLLQISEEGSLVKFSEDLALSGYRPRKFSALPATETGGFTGLPVRPAASSPSRTLQSEEWTIDEETRKRRMQELAELSAALRKGQ